MLEPLVIGVSFLAHQWTVSSLAPVGTDIPVLSQTWLSAWINGFSAVGGGRVNRD